MEGCTMKKLRLDMETLHVESFATHERSAGSGTVRAYWTQAWESACGTAAADTCYSSTIPQPSQGCTIGCDDTWGETQTDASQQCSRNTCVGCTNEN
jgi:hypothetical protein